MSSAPGVVELSARKQLRDTVMIGGWILGGSAVVLGLMLVVALQWAGDPEPRSDLASMVSYTYLWIGMPWSLGFYVSFAAFVLGPWVWWLLAAVPVAVRVANLHHVAVLEAEKRLPRTGYFDDWPTD